MKAFLILLGCVVAVAKANAMPKAQGGVAEFRADGGLDNSMLLNSALRKESQGVDREPVQFAHPLKVNLSPQNGDGNWEEEDGSRVWTLRVESKGALNINLGFKEYNLPEGATLEISGEDQRLRTFTAEDNQDHGQLWTPPMDGDHALITLTIPSSMDETDVRLTLSQIGHGFRTFGAQEPSPMNLAAISGSCNVDVACSEASDWRNQIRSVGMYIIDGVEECTGALINNVRRDRRPLFLTGNHCRISPETAASMVVLWNFEHSRCRPIGSRESGEDGDGPKDQFTAGARWLDGDETSDFALVELSGLPRSSYNVYYAGWDARPVEHNGAVTIHHPSNDEKRISFFYRRTTTTLYPRDEPRSDGTHIRIDGWDIGTTEGGSSGSPLFNMDRRIVGQLHGGYAACGNSQADWYGRLSYSWNRGLGRYLDPDNTGTQILNGMNP